MPRFYAIPHYIYPPDCDCGLPASWFMLVPVGDGSDYRTVQIPLCADCYRIENDPREWISLRHDIRHYTWLLYDFSYKAMELR